MEDPEQELAREEPQHNGEPQLQKKVPRAFLRQVIIFPATRCCEQ